MFKKRAAILIFAVILLSSFVYACDSSQRILRISASTNAQGETYEGAGNYPIEICYDSLFGEIYEGASPQVSTGSNDVLFLSSTTNAHASYLSSSDYNTKIAYGDLICTKKTKAEGCDLGEKLIVSLSDLTNAHLASDNSYENLICCQSPSAIVEVTGAYWYNLAKPHSIITTADLNDLVKLVATGEGFEGKTITYEIFKEGGGFLWFDSKEATIDTSGSTTWKANEAGDYYFTATSGTKSFPSGNLKISATENNEPPTAVITSPEDVTMFPINTLINFAHDSYDADGLITNPVEWDTNGDGTYDKLQDTFSLSYSEDGLKNIALRVIDDGNPIKDNIMRIAILIYKAGERYLFASIETPTWDENFWEDNIVDFDASDTYEFSVDGSGNLQCEIGDCGDVGQGEAIEDADLDFDWAISGNGEQETESGLDFGMMFGVGQYESEVEITSGELSEKDYTIFNILQEDETEHVCGIENNEYGWWINENSNLIFHPNLEFGCEDSAGVPDDTCCPPYHKCADIEEDVKRCIIGDTTSCAQYDDKSSCETDQNNVAVGEIGDLTDKTCDPSIIKFTEDGWVRVISDCRCQWDEDECQSTYDSKILCEYIDENHDHKECRDGNEGGNGEIEGQCIVSPQTIGECKGGYRELSWTATWTGFGSAERPEDCKDGSKQIPCLPGTSLNFFGFLSFITAISLIIIFYLYRKSE